MNLEFVDLVAGDYDRAKKVFNAARHPGFVGRELFFRCSTTGRSVVAVMDGVDVGVALVARGKLQAMSVVAKAQGGGVGGRLLAHVHPRFASVIAERVEWFKKRGYKTVGSPSVGQSGKHITQLMELDDSTKTDDTTVSVAAPDAYGGSPQMKKPEPIRSLLSLVPTGAILPKELLAEIEMLDEIYARAIQADKFDSALKISERAHLLIGRGAKIRRQ